MDTNTRTHGRFGFADWTEEPVGEEGVLPRLARATVVNTFSGRIEAAGTRCSYTIAYVGESAGTFAGMEVLTGTVDGRKGSFVLAERGGFDAEGTRCTFEVVPGSGTGELAGLRGSGGFTYRHGEVSVAYTFDCELGVSSRER
ncbi:DUF3224 domain-containing protein [Streptomyces venezuelae]|uniref:DUF3224 domain-containing protein n=1 Tax=Streptomyces venezuelae TaxID=54571 RepID=A0A5P2CYM0_STRVZ|nr:DUF3224 domain-containing protein [Streptomyces venezuelae]QES46878.1 DUF3224 domain-containing protein [Streptomyces venezuelae]